MHNLSPQMQQKFSVYPCAAKDALLTLRAIILDLAMQNNLQELEETLKWGQPSYLGKHASTIRIDWNEKDPDHYRVYFICNTLLVETFRELYPKDFNYEANRVIVFSVGEKLPLNALKHCLTMALNYHKIKHLPLLGN